MPTGPGIPAICAFSLLDCTAYLSPFGHGDPLVVNGHVNFLPGNFAAAHGALVRTQQNDFAHLALLDWPLAAVPAAPASPAPEARPPARPPAAPVHPFQPDFAVTEELMADFAGPRQAFACAIAAWSVAQPLLEQGTGTLHSVANEHVVHA